MPCFIDFAFDWGILNECSEIFAIATQSIFFFGLVSISVVNGCDAGVSKHSRQLIRACLAGWTQIRIFVLSRHNLFFSMAHENQRSRLLVNGANAGR